MKALRHDWMRKANVGNNRQSKEREDEKSFGFVGYLNKMPLTCLQMSLSFIKCTRTKKRNYRMY